MPEAGGIHLFFEGTSPSYAVTLGPAPWYRISGNFIREGPAGRIVAIFRRHMWDLADHSYTRFDCRDPALIHFEDSAGGTTEDFGPIASFFAADGVLYAEGKLFAKFIEETQLWHSYVTENFWPAMIIKPAPPPTGPRSATA